MKYVLYLFASCILVFLLFFLNNLSLGVPAIKSSLLSLPDGVFLPALSLPFVIASQQLESYRRLLLFPISYVILCAMLGVIVPYGDTGLVTQNYHFRAVMSEGVVTTFGTVYYIIKYAIVLIVLIWMQRIFIDKVPGRYWKAGSASGIAVLNTVFFMQENISINAGRLYVVSGPDGDVVQYFNIIMFSVLCFLASFMIAYVLVLSMSFIVRLVRGLVGRTGLRRSAWQADR
jgi:hypothetical protein